MKKLLQIVSLALIFSATSLQSFATHIVGGTLTYEYLGGNQYRIYLTVYRDCFGGQAPFDDPAVVGIFNSSNQQVTTVSMDLGTVTQIPGTINNPCTTPPTNVCTEVTTYTGVVTLPPIAGGYQMAYQRCCRNAVIQNIVDPGDVGSTFYTQIPNATQVGNNSSAEFTNLPPLYLCSGLQFVFDHSATDADGDQLVYSLCTPHDGLDPTTPGGNGFVPDPPPYGFVSWTNPYSLNDMMGGTQPLTINPTTGQLIVTPNTIGTFVVGICVSEVRNGVVINTVQRDFQFTVANCNVQVISSFFTPNIQCGNFVQFTNNSQGATGYSWDFGDGGTSNQQAPNHTYTNIGSYVVTLVALDNVTGCADTSILNLTLIDTLTAYAGDDVAICSGDGVQLNASGGISYTWTPSTGLDNPNIANPIASPTVTTQYFVTVVDSAGCSGVDSLTVTINPPPVIDAGADTAVCAGECVQLNATGGLTFSWSPATGLSDANIANPVACPTQTTTYTVTVSGPSGNLVANGDFSQGNTGFTSDYTFSNNLQPESRYSVVADASTVHPSFVGNDHTNPPTGQFMAVNGAGTPGVDVWCQTVPVTPNTDYAFSTWVSSLVGNSPAILQFSINGVPLATPFSAPGSINTWDQFFATWNSGNATTATICILNQNTTLGGNDFGLDDIVFSTFCDGTAQITVTVNPLPVVNAGQDTTICIGDVIQLNGTGGPSWSWSPSVGLSDTAIANPIANPVVTTTYILTVDDGTCVNADTVVVTVNPLPIADAGADVQICFGDSVQLNGSGGTTYIWSPATGLSNDSIANPWANPTVDTEYVLTADNGGCIDTDTVFVTVLLAPIADAGLDVFICQGDTTQLTATGGVSYSWTPATDISDVAIANPEVWPNFPTTYYVTVTDANGCTDVDSIFVDVFAVIATGDTIVCFGDSAQLSVSPTGSSITWTPSAYLNDATIANPLASPPVTTTFYVLVDNGTGCTSTDSVVVTVQPLPIADAGGDVQICDGNSAQLLATGGVTYLWNPSTGLSDTTIANPIATPAGTTTYVVIVSDQIGCSSSDTVTVTINPLPPADAGQDVAICAGDTAQLLASGGVFYTWTPSTGLSNDSIANPEANPTNTTTYSVLVQGPSGQQVVNPDFSGGDTGFSSGYTYGATTPNSGLYTVTNDASLADPSFTGLGHGGSGDFMVVNANMTYGTDVWCQTFDVAPNNDYYFSAWLSTLVLDDPALLQLTVNGTPVGSPFTTPPFGVATWSEFWHIWNSGNNTSITLCIENITTTTGPTAFGLDDVTFAPFCENTAQVTVTVNPLPVVDAGQDISICIGEDAQLEASGGDIYSWTPAATLNDDSIANPVATPINTTTYNVHVVTNAGCEGDGDVVVTVNPLPTAFAGVDAEFCAGNSVQLNATGGATYSWSPSTGLSADDIANPVAGPSQTTTYIVTVGDQNQCQDTDTLTVTVNQLPVADAGDDLPLCLGDTVQLNATGGVSYVWDPGTGLSNTNIADPLAFPIQPITYTVTVTDANGCEDTDDIAISIFSITATPNDAICNGESLQLSVSGGTSFVWTPTDGLDNPNIGNPLASPDETTTYTVVATDANGCEATAQLTVEVLAAPTAGFTAHYIPSCEGIVGQFTNGSTGAETFLWVFANGDTSTLENPEQNFNVGPGTIVTLIVYNGEGCVDTAVVDFSATNYSNIEFDLLVPNIITPNADGLNDCFQPGFEGEFNECFTLKIFNRWGALIFESIAQGDCWDGRTKAGNPVDSGTYFYLLEINGIEKAGFMTVAHD
ncbi:MAG: PKD domain-containing protein [Bacteroidia bacterium]